MTFGKLLFAFMIGYFLFIPFASAEGPQKSAFTRDHKLWIKRVDEVPVISP